MTRLLLLVVAISAWLAGCTITRDGITMGNNPVLIQGRDDAAGDPMPSVLDEESGREGRPGQSAPNAISR
ncbi:hypothetical protein D3870_20730 [Noviherbaspirillum cavernae]|uniref:Uncharacterized protein n=1 Tax=Noviherbaspirillum cavernae TaxID=2320862 RepID=A0A418WVR0_9BURK|nr:hypothetical protein [Noviherbaspirillum cavernae]RJF96812.1 hypothetical protein D3870_20730 [Noviherbaspirillum cavernae]